MKQKLQQWQQFMSDLDNIWDWLGETEEELAQLRRLDASTDIQTIEQRIKKLKVTLLDHICFFSFNNFHFAAASVHTH